MDMTKQKGDAINQSLTTLLSNSGVTGDSTLEGNEEAQTFGNQRIVIDQIRNAVRQSGEMSEQRPNFNLREEARVGLLDWKMQELDDEIFTQLSASPTTNRSLEVDSAASSGVSAGSTITNVGTTDTMTTAAISAAKRLAIRPTGGARKIRPIRLDNGIEVFFMFIDTFAARDLRNSADWLSNHRDAGPRGDENAIFRGALGIHDGVVLIECDKVIRVSNATNFVARNLLVGAQAGCVAFADPLFWREKHDFDYGNQVGFAIGDKKRCCQDCI